MPDEAADQSAAGTTEPLRAPVLLPEHVVEADPKELEPGDVIPDVVLLHPIGNELQWIRKSGGKGIGYVDHPTAPRKGDRGKIIHDAELTDIVLLSYSCEIDKELVRVRDGDRLRSADICVATRVDVQSKYSMVDAIKEGRDWSKFYIPRSGADDLVADFSWFQRVRISCVVEAALKLRTCGMTIDGMRILLEAFARYLGAGRLPGPGEALFEQLRLRGI